jgi:hypothetical protein
MSANRRGMSCSHADNLVLVAAFLAARGAELVVVGGCALRLHGHDHVPADLDVVPEPTDHALATRDVVTRVTPVGSVDVLLRRGRDDYAALEGDATSMSVSGHAVRVAAINDVLRLRARFGKEPLCG